MERSVLLMKKQICIVHSSMELGGAETSLIGLLNSIDYNKYDVDLCLLNPVGELMKQIPDEVNLMSFPDKYSGLILPIKEVIKRKMPEIASARILGKIQGKSAKYRTYVTKQYAYYYAMPFLPSVQKKYDMAISFIDPHFIVETKINADIKLGWLHTDFSRVSLHKKLDAKMWSNLDYIVTISEGCKEKFDKFYPELSDKTIVIENILSENFIVTQSKKYDEKDSFFNSNCIKALSVGRFCKAKNFDNIPDICSRLIKKGLNLKWYIIGYGSDEELIKQKIKQANMESNVIILGKKENPYPYIKNCDLYVQPSRYEGKCVAVREAQILNKPVVITAYGTSESQLKNGYDGVIVPMDNEGCAEGIYNVLTNKELLECLAYNCSQNDYSNSQEIKKLYEIINKGAT